MPIKFLLLCALIACRTAVAWAEEAPDPTTTDAVEVRIGTVVASNAGSGSAPAFDKRLASVWRQLDSLFPYSSYRLINEERRRVEWKREAEFRLPGGRYLLVIPRGYKDGRVSLNLMLIQGTRPLLNTVLALRNHGTFLVGGPSHEEGVLIIAIGAGTTK